MHNLPLLKIKIITVVFIYLVTYNSTAYSRTKLDSLFLELDKTIELSQQYSKIKEEKICSIKEKLKSANALETKFKLYKQIFNHYEAFICDSAYYYSLQSLALAEQHEDIYWINESKLQISSTLKISGMFPESIGLLASINKKSLEENQILNYYSSYYHAYDEWGEYAEYEYSKNYKVLAKEYQDSILQIVKPNTFEYIIEYAWYYIQQGEYDKAEKTIASYLVDLKSNTRDYAMMTSVAAILYWYKNDIEKHKEFLAISAISDVKASIKENTSLRSLANILFNEGGDLERANRYIKKSLDDANFYDARLRNIQISRSYPLIVNAYQNEREAHQKKLHIFLVLVSILSILLVFTIMYIISQYRKLTDAKQQALIANEKLKDRNILLAEANKIKEEYLGRFLNLCSLYIEKMQKHHHMLNDKAREGNIKELYKALKSNDFIEDELTAFYHDFDSAFLKIFPSFVSQFNALLIEKERIVCKQDDKLTTELRVFALIRLGITDSHKIAEFLRYSISTIYNYRSKYRVKSIVPRDDFENEIMKISSH